MKYKVKITVIDKKLYPELQQQYCHDPIRVSVLAIMWEMNLYFIVMMKE